MKFFHRFAPASVLLAGVIFASCTHQSLPGTVETTPATHSAAARFDAPGDTNSSRPPRCKGQKSTTQYAGVGATLSASGGSLCVPEYRGWGGSITYPSLVGGNAVGVTVTSSTTDYNGLLALPQPGTPLFYLQISFSSGVGFNTQLAKSGALYAPKLRLHKAYTFFGAENPGSLAQSFTPCYSIAANGKYGVEISGLGAMLKGATLTATNSVIEVYKGKLSTKRC
jgi:hypothetical protein